MRAADGVITTFDVSGAGTAPNQGTLGQNINTPGTINGNYIDANGANHGFVLSKDGTITTFDPLGAGTGSGQGTSCAGISPSGAVTGWYVDSNQVAHGYLRNP